MIKPTTLVLLMGLCAAPAWAEDPQVPPPEAPAADEAAPVPAPVPAADPAVPAPAVEGGKAPGTTPDKAPEATVPATDEEAVQTALSLLEAMKAGQWPLAVGLGLTLLVYAVSRFALKSMLSEKAVPFLAFGVGVAGAVGTGLITGTSLVEAITAGVIAGIAAVGGWEAVAKLMASKPTGSSS